MKRAAAIILAILIVTVPAFCVIAKDGCYNTETITAYGVGNVGFAKYETTFDAKGRIIKMTEYAPEGAGFVPSGKTERAYDKYGNVSKETYYGYAAGEWTLRYSSESKYRKDGQVLTEIEKNYVGGEVTGEYRASFEYDANGNVISSKTVTDAGGSVTETETRLENVYDGKNRLVKRTTFELSGGEWAPVYVEYYDYDEAENAEYYRYYVINGGKEEPFEKDKYVRDADGMVIYHENWAPDGKGGFENFYKEEIVYKNGDVQSSREYRWDGVKWVLDGSYSADFDGNMNLTHYVEKYSVTTPSETYGEEVTLTYDEQNRITSTYELTYSVSENKYVDDLKTDYTYDDETGGIVRNHYLKNGEKWELSMKYVTEYDGHHTHIVKNDDGTYKCADCGALLYDETGKLLSPDTGDNTVIYVIIGVAVVVVSLVVLKLLKKKKDE